MVEGSTKICTLTYPFTQMPYLVQY